MLGICAKIVSFMVKSSQQDAFQNSRIIKVLGEPAFKIKRMDEHEFEIF